MELSVKRRMTSHAPSAPPELLGLPDAAVLEVLRHLDGRSLAILQRTASYFNRKDPVTRLPLTEHVARETLLRACHSPAEAERFRRRSWTERLHLQQDAACGFDRLHCEASGFKFQFTPNGRAMRGVRLTGMGPKLLVSDATTRSQPVLRWQLRVRGNTAVEFGVIPAALEPAHTALHKCLSVPDDPRERAMGFCSQITAGSLLPLKAPVMRGTVLDLVARRGHIEVLLRYPEDAREISWHNGQPVHKPYRGPSQLRLEQDFGDGYDVRLAVTAWAKGSFDVLHAGFAFDPEWAQECCAAELAEAAAAAAAGAQAGEPAEPIAPAVEVAPPAAAAGPAAAAAGDAAVPALPFPFHPAAPAPQEAPSPAAPLLAAMPAAAIPPPAGQDVPESPFALLLAAAAGLAPGGPAGPVPAPKEPVGGGDVSDDADGEGEGEEGPLATDVGPADRAGAMPVRLGHAGPGPAAAAAEPALQQLLLPLPPLPLPHRTLSSDGHAVPLAAAGAGGARRGPGQQEARPKPKNEQP